MNLASLYEDILDKFTVKCVTCYTLSRKKINTIRGELETLGDVILCMGTKLFLTWIIDSCL